MFGGDEISAIVLDIGSTTVRAGYAGEDVPKAVFPTQVGVIYNTGSTNIIGNGQQAVGDSMDTDAPNKFKQQVNYHVGTSGVEYRRDYMEVKSPFDKGLITDFDMIEQLYDHAFKHRLRLDPKEHPILVTEPAYNTKMIREKVTEIMFEKYDLPAFFLSKNPVLTSFSSGKASALVVDTGGYITSVSAVHDGYSLQRTIIKSSLAGELLVDEYYRILGEKSKKIRPHYMFSKKEIRPAEFEITTKEFPNTTNSFTDYMIKHTIRDIKETSCRVADTPFDEDANVSIPSVPYELPDGQILEVGAERFKLPEYMFNPIPLNKRKHYDEEFISIQQMIFNSIAKCDADIRRDMFNSIILAGGNSLLAQFPERLNKELSELCPPQMYKVKVLAGSPPERKYSTWVGGSILASLGTFHQMWMSKQEYEEHGAAMVERKCP